MFRGRCSLPVLFPECAGPSSSSHRGPHTARLPTASPLASRRGWRRTSPGSSDGLWTGSGSGHRLNCRSVQVGIARTAHPPGRSRLSASFHHFTRPGPGLFPHRAHVFPTGRPDHSIRSSRRTRVAVMGSPPCNRPGAGEGIPSGRAGGQRAVTGEERSAPGRIRFAHGRQRSAGPFG